MNDALRGLLYSLGADLVGFADLTSLPDAHRGGLSYGVAIGIALDPDIIAMIPERATKEYYDAYVGTTDKLEEIAREAACYLEVQGYQAVAQTLEYVSGQRRENNTEASPGYALIPHKTVAALAGFGWITKSALLVTPEYGSAVRLASVLTDAPLETAAADYRCCCGGCTVCADACPGKAIKGTLWSQDTSRDELIDFSACANAVIERGRALGKKNGTCGICFAVCPHTQRYI